MYFITYLDCVNVSTAAAGFAKDFKLNKTEIGLVFSAFAYPYLVFQIFGGWISDRFGARRTLIACGLIWASATALTGLAGGLASLLLARVLLGLGEGASFPAATTAMSRWVAMGQRGYAQGVTHAAARIGNAVAPAVIVFLMAAWGWRASFYVCAALSFSWVALWALTFTEHPKNHPRVTEAELAMLPAPYEAADEVGRRTLNCLGCPAARSCSLLAERYERGSGSSRRSVAAIAGRTQPELGNSSAEHLHGKHHNAKRSQGQHHKHGHSVEQRQQVFHGRLTRWRFLGHSRCGSLGCDRNIMSWPSDGAGARERKLKEKGRHRTGWMVRSFTTKFLAVSSVSARVSRRCKRGMQADDVVTISAAGCGRSVRFRTQARLTRSWPFMSNRRGLHRDRCGLHRDRCGLHREPRAEA